MLATFNSNSTTTFKLKDYAIQKAEALKDATKKIKHLNRLAHLMKVLRKDLVRLNNLYWYDSQKVCYCYNFLIESFLVNFSFPWLILCTLYVPGENGGGKSGLFGIIEGGGLQTLFIACGAPVPLG